MTKIISEDDNITVDQETFQRAERIAEAAYRRWQQALNSPEFDELYHPDVGDMALEITSILRREPAFTRLGRIVERCDLSETLAEDDYVVLELLDGSQLKWSNAKFIKVLEPL